MLREKWYCTGLLIALLVLSVSILLVRWNTIRQRVPLLPAGEVIVVDQAVNMPVKNTASPVRPSIPAVIDLNSAIIIELQELPGIGPVLAGRIVEFRESRGPFTHVNDLLSVEGIGQSKLAAIKGLVHVGGG